MSEDRIAELEHQMRQLQTQLAEERTLRLQEHDAAQQRVKQLETKMASSSSASPSAKRVPSSSSSAAKTRTLITSGARTSDGLFAAASPIAKAPSSRATPPARTTSGNRAVGAGSRSPAASSNPRSAAAPAYRTQPTALEHAWSKFCHAARAEFSATELGLVSVGTLSQLLDRYHVRDEVERAQIEAQWSLLQSDENALQAADFSATTPSLPLAGGRPVSPGGLFSPLLRAATALSARSDEKKARRPVLVSQERHQVTTPRTQKSDTDLRALENGFELRPVQQRPHLSSRAPLEHAGVRGSNPNEVQSGSGEIPARRTTPIKPRHATVSNPNESEGVTGIYRPGVRRLERASTPPIGNTAAASSPSLGQSRRQGIGMPPPPQSSDITPRGIRSGGSTVQSSEVLSPQGIRVHIGPREQRVVADEGGDRRAGLRTFSPTSSPTASRGPSRFPSSAQLEVRTTLATASDSAAKAVRTRHRSITPPLSPRQARTPFALDS